MPHRYHLVVATLALSVWVEWRHPPLASAQPSATESVAGELTSAENAAEIDLNQTLQQGETALNERRYQDAWNHFSHALEIYRSMMDAQGVSESLRADEADTLTRMGSVYLLAGFDYAASQQQTQSAEMYQAALPLYEQALAIYREIHDQGGEVLSLNAISNALSKLGRYEEAIDGHYRALAIAEAIDDHSGQANSLGGLSTTYYAQTNYPLAIELALRQLPLIDKQTDPLRKASIYGLLGNSHAFLGDDTQAMSYFHQQLELLRQQGNRSQELMALAAINGLFTQNVPRALTFYETSLAFAREQGEHEWELSTLAAIALMQGQQKNYPAMLERLEQALAMAQDNPDPDLAISLYGEIFIRRLIAGYQVEQKQYEEAIAHYQHALNLATRLNAHGTGLLESDV